MSYIGWQKCIGFQRVFKMKEIPLKVGFNVQPPSEVEQQLFWTNPAFTASIPLAPAPGTVFHSTTNAIPSWNSIPTVIPNKPSGESEVDVLDLHFNAIKDLYIQSKKINDKNDRTIGELLFQNDQLTSENNDLKNQIVELQEKLNKLKALL